MACSLGTTTPNLSYFLMYEFILRTCVHIEFPSRCLHANRASIVSYISTHDVGRLITGGEGGRVRKE